MGRCSTTSWPTSCSSAWRLSAELTLSVLLSNLLSSLEIASTLSSSMTRSPLKPQRNLRSRTVSATLWTRLAPPSQRLSARSAKASKPNTNRTSKTLMSTRDLANERIEQKYIVPYLKHSILRNKKKTLFFPPKKKKKKKKKK